MTIDTQVHGARAAVDGGDHGVDRPADYRDGHIPGAVFVDLHTDLAGPRRPGTGRHPLPDPEAFAASMAGLGIGDRTRVVAYDDAGGSIAARLWWMLDVTGHGAALLDGGLRAWAGPLETGFETPKAGTAFTARPWPRDLVVDVDDVERVRHDPAMALLDARAPQRYRGESEPLDTRAGHIPGARNATWRENLDPATDRFRSPDELRAWFASLGADRAGEVVASCGSGVTACHEIVALRLAGIAARLYPGSWSEWIADPERPIAVGDAPGG